MDPVHNPNITAELLQWHRPEITRLSVTLDTRNAVGSGVDAENLTSPTPG